MQTAGTCVITLTTTGGWLDLCLKREKLLRTVYLLHLLVLTLFTSTGKAESLGFVCASSVFVCHEVRNRLQEKSLEIHALEPTPWLRSLENSWRKKSDNSLQHWRSGLETLLKKRSTSRINNEQLRSFEPSTFFPANADLQMLALGDWLLIFGLLRKDRQILAVWLSQNQERLVPTRWRSLLLEEDARLLAEALQELKSRRMQPIRLDDNEPFCHAFLLDYARKSVSEMLVLPGSSVIAAKVCLDGRINLFREIIVEQVLPNIIEIKTDLSKRASLMEWKGLLESSTHEETPFILFAGQEINKTTRIIYVDGVGTSIAREGLSNNDLYDWISANLHRKERQSTPHLLNTFALSGQYLQSFFHSSLFIESQASLQLGKGALSGIFGISPKLHQISHSKINYLESYYAAALGWVFDEQLGAASSSAGILIGVDTALSRWNRWVTQETWASGYLHLPCGALGSASIRCIGRPGLRASSAGLQPRWSIGVDISWLE